MISIKFVTFVCLLFIGSIYSAVVEDSNDAKLLVSKTVINNYVVEGLNLTVKYTIYNIGNVAALNVNLQDENFPAGKFEYVDGFSTVNWPKIPASSNVTHTAVVVPKTVGLFNFTHATVSYLSNDKATKSQVGYSTELGQAYIQSSKEYNRRFASHTIDWALFGLMSVPSVVLPFFLWYNSKVKYEAMLKNNKKDKSN